MGSGNSTIYCADDDACFGNLTIDKDTVSDLAEIPASNTVRVAGDLNVNEGMLKIYDQTTLELGNEFNVNNGTMFYTLGNASNDAVITGYDSAFYTLNVESGATIGASYTTFEQVGTTGVNVKAGASIDALYSLNNCTFKTGVNGGTLLTIDNAQTLTINGAEFIAGSRDAAYNVTKNVDSGEISFGSRGEKVFLTVENTTSTTTYKIVFPTLVNDGAVSVMQISEIEFLVGDPATGQYFEEIRSSVGIDGTTKSEWTIGAS